MNWNDKTRADYNTKNSQLKIVEAENINLKSDIKNLQALLD